MVLAAVQQRGMALRYAAEAMAAMFEMLLRCFCDALRASVKSVCVNSEAAEAPGFPAVLQICLTRNSRVTAMWSRLRQDKVKEP